MKNAVSLCLSSLDLAFLCNAILEAWEASGGNRAKFEARTGESYEHSTDVHDHIRSLLADVDQRMLLSNHKDEKTKFCLSIEFDDLQLVCKAITVALEEVEEWEFQTLTAATPEEARTLLNYLQTRLTEARQ